MPHLCEQFLSEDLCRRSIAEALARRLIELVADLDQVGVGYGQGVDFSRKPFPSSAVGVLDRTFLPRRLRVAEPGLRANAGLQIGPIGELGAAIRLPSSLPHAPISKREFDGLQPGLRLAS